MIPTPHCVAVYPDGLAPTEGTFAHGLDLAGRLGWLLRFVTNGGPDQDLVPACEAACRQRDVVREVVNTADKSELHVIGETHLSALKEGTLRRVLRLPEAGVLICPRTRQPIRRALVLVQTHDPANAFLDAAVRVIRALGADPVVLAVAGTEAEARQHEEFAEARFTDRRMTAEIDSAVGANLPESVSWVARLRRCSLVVVERDKPSWRRWLRGETVERLLGLTKTVSVLALPEAAWTTTIKTASVRLDSESVRA